MFGAVKVNSDTFMKHHAADQSRLYFCSERLDKLQSQYLTCTSENQYPRAYLNFFTFPNADRFGSCSQSLMRWAVNSLQTPQKLSASEYAAFRMSQRILVTHAVKLYKLFSCTVAKYSKKLLCWDFRGHFGTISAGKYKTSGETRLSLHILWNLACSKLFYEN